MLYFLPIDSVEEAYRYSVDWQTGIDVRMVIGEYLACRVVWSR